MAQLVSEGSEETSETSTSSRVPHWALETWQRWHPGSYFFVLMVNATATACLFPRNFEFATHEGEPSVSSCPFSDRITFSSLMLASFGAGCVAAFLQKRAKASSHACLACGYAYINWFESLLGSLTCLQDDEGDDSYFRCKYGFLPETRLGKDFFHNAFEFCRLALYLIGLFWVQRLLEKRLSILEKTSRQKYCSRCLRMLIWLQALGVALVVLSFSVFAHFWMRGRWWEETPKWSSLMTGVAVSLLTWFCNMAASTVVVCSLIRCLFVLWRVLRLADSQVESADARSSILRARRFAFLQLLGVSFSLVLTICVVPAALVTSFVGVLLPEELGWVGWVAVSIQALDYLGNAIAALLLSGSHRLSEKGAEAIPPGQARRRMCFQVCHAKPRAILAKETAWSPAWEAKVEELSLRGMTLRSLVRFYQEELPSMRNWSYVPREHKTRDVVRRVIIPLTSREESSYAASTLNLDGLRRPDVMVTHNWGNRFKDMLLGHFFFRGSFWRGASCAKV